MRSDVGELFDLVIIRNSYCNFSSCTVLLQYLLFACF